MKRYVLESPFKHNQKIVDALESTGTGIIKDLEILDLLITCLCENKDEAAFILPTGKEIDLKGIEKIRAIKDDPRCY